ncbi:hypothetical protein FB45DRAFT_920552 [Roridomyces roridus]|uniref:T6SS Phospholipase effector Tle1-like catalytic domain-containing protein n=1 Tax=Roridomyces roridus TaxID=1738132 RepID=A0AAD7BPQ3_9AGAR|nr:hypothetical protein FB45DRAFT_920552 [Roridomyces roridus]
MATNGHARGLSEATLTNYFGGITGLPRTDSPFSTPQPSPRSTAFHDPTAIPPIIPPEHPFRTLILCFDGTGDQFDQDNSNIVQFLSLLPKADRSKQMVYYQAGIGTYTSPQVATPFMSKISKAVDEAIAWNLDAHVMGGYEFLMQNYTSRDRICIFGFSRGAYTARSLAGMIHKVGLLPACNHQQIPFAYKMYTREDEIGWKQSNAFKKAFSIDVDIEFVGVWDTVNSVGLIPRRLPFTASNTIVRTFRHAMALDERRAKFKVNLWHRHTAKDLELTGRTEGNHKQQQRHLSHKQSQNLFERKYSKDPNSVTDVDEVWFSGCHCDVGGGSVSNETPHNLARIPLRWMVRECFKTHSGIMFDSEALRSIGIDPASLYPIVSTRPPALPVAERKILSIKQSETITRARARALSAASIHPPSSSSSVKEKDSPNLTEEEHELADALSPLYDQLALARAWWILEFLPVQQRYQREDNSWASYVGWNMGRGRVIPLADPKEDGALQAERARVRVHRSVQLRLEAGKGKYKPRAKFDLGRVTWVD